MSLNKDIISELNRDRVNSIASLEKKFLGPVHKRHRIFLAIFYTPLPQVRILTLIYLTSTF